MPAKIDAQSGCVTVLLSGEIDHHNSKKMREDIDACTRKVQPELLVLDFGDVEFMDSSGIGMVLGRYRLMQDIGGRLMLRNMPSHIRKVMRVAGIENLNISDNNGGNEQ